MLNTKKEFYQRNRNKKKKEQKWLKDNKARRTGNAAKKDTLTNKVLLELIIKHRPESVYALAKLCKEYGYPRVYGGVKDRVQTLERKGLIKCRTKFNKKLIRVRKEIIPL